MDNKSRDVSIAELHTRTFGMMFSGRTIQMFLGAVQEYNLTCVDWKCSKEWRKTK